MHTYVVNQLPAVAEDRAEIFAWYADLVSEESALRFDEEFEQTIDSLATFPHGHTEVEWAKGIHRVNMKNHKVAILYTVNDERFEVLAVQAFHELQDPKVYQELIEKRFGTDQERG
jgi:plasmid stabilization system protein ParE